MKLYSIFVAALFVASTAHASRETIKCIQTGADRLKESVVVEFDPAISLEAQTYASGQYKGLYNTIKPGKADSSTETTANVVLNFPDFKKPYGGRFPLVEFFNVNSHSAAGGGYSYKFDNKAYDSFHGEAEGGRWDIMIYVPDASVRRASPAKFAGLLTSQMDLMDQGYYHIDLECSSTLK